MFRSRDKNYRNPVGAVAAGEKIHFRITLPRELSCSAAYLLMEKERGENRCLDMFWCGMNGDNQEWWECHFTPEETGLYFYHFEIKTCRGRLRLTRGYGGEGVFSGMDRWQLTVYSPSYKTPDWLEGGIIYQIFPDRFYNSGTPKENVPADRVIHETWGEQPVWAPNAQGKVTNNDFFGGDLKGIEEKLPYLKSLGVTCIYCNPIFESHSNHRYDTADYSKIDPLLGTEEDFTSLCNAAKEYGIRVILDGVFSHTGSDSVYFNREGRYATPGAFNSQESPYYSWYSFRHWPDSYDCWWNFDTLPNVQETQPAYDQYINGKDGIVRKWLRAGASGWRLDVADELPDPFIDNLSKASKEEKEDALVMGEVWEDASNKSAYGVRRRYLLGGQLDTVMNYPFRDAIFSFLLWGDPQAFCETVGSILENYPKQTIRLLMNHIGTHDTERAITVLAGEPLHDRGREWQSCHQLSPEQWEVGIKRMKLASLLQFTLPGIPSIYYGDEAGLEGYKDPFCRGCYPWGHEKQELLEWYRFLGKTRGEFRHILGRGDFRTCYADRNLLAYERFIETEAGEQSLMVIVNRSHRPQSIMEADLPFTQGTWVGGEPLKNTNVLPPYGWSLFTFEKKAEEKTL
jgi:cyclomaltodextrinase